MIATIEIAVPHGHSDGPTCPHCLEDLGDHLAGLYPQSDPTAIGGEHRCPACDGPILVSTYYPAPLFGVCSPAAYEDNVRHFRRPRR